MIIANYWHGCLRVSKQNLLESCTPVNLLSFRIITVMAVIVSSISANYLHFTF